MMVGLFFLLLFLPGGLMKFSDGQETSVRPLSKEDERELVEIQKLIKEAERRMTVHKEPDKYKEELVPAETGIRNILEKEHASRSHMDDTEEPNTYMRESDPAPSSRNSKENNPMSERDFKGFLQDLKEDVNKNNLQDIIIIGGVAIICMMLFGALILAINYFYYYVQSKIWTKQHRSKDIKDVDVEAGHDVHMGSSD